MQLGKPIHNVRDGKFERQLTAAQEKRRVDFAVSSKKVEWQRTMATDRCRFYFKHPGEHKKPSYWVVKGTRPRVKMVTNPQCVNVYAGITKFGITKLHLVAGTSKMKSQHTTRKGTPARNITGSEYKEVLEKTFLPEGSRLFQAAGITRWILLQDNDPTHKAAAQVIDAWNKAHPGVHVSLLPHWPGNSPDLNPIENLWAWAQAKVNAKGCSTFEEFKDCVVETLQNVPRAMLQSLMDSMHARLKACIDRNGAKTGY